ncbi:glycosyltransferase family 2 protein [Mucilaginibacter sp. RCC_168]|uniref:glycosyltransferase family 2 protein n=1 Tax=Mucilaginibacter sp. RCC_168 TaxID=3239221 RepID=UPI003525131D
MNNSLPLISCVCITENRHEFLKKSIAIYKMQTYQNKELIVVYKSDDRQTKSVLESDDSEDIIPIPVSPNQVLSLGQLRNIGIKYANGSLICCWDDDDWYHASRLEYQQAMIDKTKAMGSILTQILVYDKPKKIFYYSYERLWEGSIMCEKEMLLDFQYSNQDKGEDTHLINILHVNQMLCLIKDKPNLYTYQYHGNNTWDSSHFNDLFSLSIALKNEISVELSRIIDKEEFSLNDSSEVDNLLEISLAENKNNS